MVLHLTPERQRKRYWRKYYNWVLICWVSLSPHRWWMSRYSTLRENRMGAECCSAACSILSMGFWFLQSSKTCRSADGVGEWQGQLCFWLRTSLRTISIQAVCCLQLLRWISACCPTAPAHMNMLRHLKVTRWHPQPGLCFPPGLSHHWATWGSTEDGYHGSTAHLKSKEILAQHFEDIE